MSALVVLVGAPGSGKSSVGAALAERLGAPHLDVDPWIEQREGALIREIFADHGEPYFRELERRATLEALDVDAVVSLGGGAVLNADIRAALAGRPVVWLQVSVHDAVKRIGLDQGRPLLMSNMRATLIRLLKERTPLYEEVASLTLDTAERDVAQLADGIASWLQERAA